MPTTEGLLERIPSAPMTTLAVLELCDDPHASLDELCRLVSQDPGLSARILARANSPAVSAGREVTTIARAAVLMGFERLRSIALGLSVVADLPRIGRIGALDLDEHWARTATTAVAARELAVAARPAVVEEAYLGGVLAGIGRIALAVADPGAHARLPSGYPENEAEEQLFGVGGDELGAMLLGSWGLPSVFAWAPLMCAGRTPTLDEGPQVAQLAPVLAAAGELTRSAFGTGPRDGWRFRRLVHGDLALADAQVVTLVEDLADLVAESLRELGVDTAPAHRVAELLARVLPAATADA